MQTQTYKEYITVTWRLSIHIMHTRLGRLKCAWAVWEIAVGTFGIHRCLGNIFSVLHSQLVTHVHAQIVISWQHQHYIHFLYDLFLFSLPIAFPTGLILQVDGKERRADCVCGGQRHLPQTHVTATGLFLPLQWCLHRHQEEEVRLCEVADNRWTVQADPVFDRAGVSVALVCRLCS